MNSLTYHEIINLLYIFILGPILLYISYQKTFDDDIIYHSIMVIGIILFLNYMIYLIQNNFIGNKNLEYMLIAFIIAPCLFYIGYMKKNTPRKYHELMLLMSFGLIGYNMFNFIRYRFYE